MKNKKLCAGGIRKSVSCGLILLFLLCGAGVTGCGKKTAAKIRPGRSDQEISSDVKGLVLKLIRPYRGANQLQLDPTPAITIDKIRQSQDDPDVYYAKVLAKGKFGTELHHIRIEYLNDTVQVKLIE